MFLRLYRETDLGYALTTVITLNGSGADVAGSLDGTIKASTYRIGMPDPDITRTARSGVDGETVTRIRRSNITESVDIIVDDSAGAVSTLYDQLQYWLQQAELRRETGLGDRIWIEYLPYRNTGSSSTAFQSELLAGNVELTDVLPTRPFRDGKGQLTLIWERKPWWESPEEEMSLSNGNGSGTGGIIVQGTDDATYDNWVDLPNYTSIIPTPAKLTITNSTSGKSIDRVFVSANFNSGGDSFGHILEGEDTDFATGTSTSESSASAGAYMSLTWTGSEPYEEKSVAIWTLDNTFSANAYGNQFRILAYLFEKPSDSDFEMRVVAQTTGALDLLETDWVTLDSNRHIQEIATIQWPPRLRAQSNIADVRFALNVRHADTASHTIKLDFVQFSPLDGWRKYFVIQAPISATNSIIDDPISDVEPYVDLSGKKSPDLIAFGDPIMLEHEAGSGTQRLYFLMEAGTSETTSVDMQAKVQVHYRPRYMYPPE